MELSLDSHDPNRGAMGTNCARTAGQVGDPGATARDNRLRGSCGLRAQALRGVICRRNSATGSLSTRAFGVGHKKAHGSGFLRGCRMIPASNMSWSTRRISGSINMEPAQKGDSKTDHWLIARRPDDEDRGARRCSRQFDPLRAAARPSPRRHEF